MKLKEEGVDIIIVLSHCGLDVDYRIAKEAAPYVDVIVGGHSHTFMYTAEEGETPPGPDEVKDNYPAVVENADGHTVLIVQASAYVKYVGDITVYFDKDGNVANWTGKPFYLDSHIKPGDDDIRNFFKQFSIYILFKCEFNQFLFIATRRGGARSDSTMEKNCRC